MYSTVRPYCRKGQQVVYNIARNEEAKISCELLANPQVFIKMFNNVIAINYYSIIKITN